MLHFRMTGSFWNPIMAQTFTKMTVWSHPTQAAEQYIQVSHIWIIFTGQNTKRVFPHKSINMFLSVFPPLGSSGYSMRRWYATLMESASEAARCSAFPQIQQREVSRDSAWSTVTRMSACTHSQLQWKVNVAVTVQDAAEDRLWHACWCYLTHMDTHKTHLWLLLLLTPSDVCYIHAGPPAADPLASLSLLCCWTAPSPSCSTKITASAFSSVGAFSFDLLHLNKNVGVLPASHFNSSVLRSHHSTFCRTQN